MYDYKALHKVIVTLGVCFVVVLGVLLLSCRPLGGFALISALIMLAVGGYLIFLPLKFLEEMKELERLVELYKSRVEKLDSKKD